MYFCDRQTLDNEKHFLLQYPLYTNKTCRAEIHELEHMETEDMCISIIKVNMSRLL